MIKWILILIGIAAIVVATLDFGLFIKEGVNPIFENITKNNDNSTVTQEVWVEIYPVQCLANPWERDWLSKNNNSDYPREDSKKNMIIKEYYQNQGISILNLKTESTFEIVCEACSCPAGYKLSLLVYQNESTKLLENDYKLSQ